MFSVDSESLTSRNSVQEKVNFLKHIVSTKGITTDPENVKPIHNNSVKEIIWS